jgi:hypothetical protein
MNITESRARLPIRSLPIAAIAVLAGLAASTDAEAQGSRAMRGAPIKVITACSRYGSDCITAPTRPARFGPEVRLPGGTWISCKLDCKSTLRDETIDFWRVRELEMGRRGFRRR